MPLELQVIRSNEFVCLDPQEHLDFQSSKDALQSLALACRKRGLDCALLDLRDLPIPSTPLFTPTELAQLVESFHEAGFGQNQRLGVLYRHDPHGGTRMFAFINRLQGWQVRVFHDFEEALLWLSEKPDQSECRPDEEAPVRITRRQDKT